MPKEAVHVLIQGRVQGVGFRYFAQACALEFGLSGWVQNLPDGSVEAYAEGLRADLEKWIARLRQGPPLGRVESIRAAWQTPQGILEVFVIR